MAKYKNSKETSTFVMATQVSVDKSRIKAFEVKYPDTNQFLGILIQDNSPKAQGIVAITPQIKTRIFPIKDFTLATFWLADEEMRREMVKAGVIKL